MSRSLPPSPLDPLSAAIAELSPDLTARAVRRVAAMAVAMRLRALNHDGCTADHLRADGFSAAEIDMGGPLARAALDATDTPRPAAPPPFTAADARALAAARARLLARPGLALGAVDVAEAA